MCSCVTKDDVLIAQPGKELAKREMVTNEVMWIVCLALILTASLEKTWDIYPIICKCVLLCICAEKYSHSNTILEVNLATVLLRGVNLFKLLVLMNIIALVPNSNVNLPHVNLHVIHLNHVADLNVNVIFHHRYDYIGLLPSIHLVKVRAVKINWVCPCEAIRF